MIELRLPTGPGPLFLGGYLVSGKCFTSYEDQIGILKSRGLTIPDHQKAIEILSFENYYRLINGYKDLFLATSGTTETYKTGASLSEIYALYRFDEDLKAQFFRAFLIIENHLKAIIAYEFAKGHGACGYLDATNYNYIPKNQTQINRLIGKIQDIIKTKSCYDRRLQHYKCNHNGDIPLWVIINLLTMGNASKFFKFMQAKEQNEVARRFSLLPNIVNNYFNNISLARNICAHGERFCTFGFTTEINLLPEHSLLRIPTVQGKPIQGVKDLFAVLLMVKYLLNDANFFDKIKAEIAQSLTDLKEELVCITIDEVMEMMGFPINWELV